MGCRGIAHLLRTSWQVRGEESVNHRQTGLTGHATLPQCHMTAFLVQFVVIVEIGRRAL